MVALQPEQGAVDVHDLTAAVQEAHLPTLLMVLFQLTGSPKWLCEPYRPTPARGIEIHAQGGLSAAVQAQIRDAAVEAITAWANGAVPAVPSPVGGLLGEMANCAFGEEVPKEYQTMMASQMGFSGRGDAAPGVNEELARSRDYSVAIIGVGISGMYAALCLREAGIPHVIIERQADVGGVWRQNTYPGAGVDTPSHLYSFPFFHRRWSSHFARQPEVLEYLEELAQAYALKEHIRFNTEVRSATYDEVQQCWTLAVRDGDGEDDELVVSAVISAVGLFKEPAIPDIEGINDFTGPIFHSSQWPEGLDISGQRVAVIGTGASAMQIVPAIADCVAHLDVFQRSPQWVAPVSHYFDPVQTEHDWLCEHVPFYRQWYRARLGWIVNDKVYPSLLVDPDWPNQERSVNATNDRHREFFTRYIMSELADRPDLQAKSVPSYPIYGKRILLDNGWYAALKKPEVELITQAVASITPTGIRTVDGTEHPADVIVLSTGFQTNNYLHPIEFFGRDGVRLHDRWDGDDARAYLGLATTGFPNLFFMYGPATNAGGGSYLTVANLFAECIVKLITWSLKNGYGAVEPRPEVHDSYNDRMDEQHSRMIWTHPGMSTYVRNSKGRVTVNMPWRIVDYWQFTHDLDMADFAFDPAASSRRCDKLEHSWPRPATAREMRE